MRIATDIGGTFTDIVYLDEDGRIGINKTDSTPPNFEEGVIEVIKQCAVHGEDVIQFVHGTTVVINAMTERKGVKTALLATKGFRDMYEIARGNRPDLFNLRFEKSQPFVPRYLRREVEERLNYKGEVLNPVNRDDVIKWVDYFKKEGVEAIAVAFLHSYLNDSHEREVVELIRELWPGVSVTASSEITKEWREYERTSSAVLNSYVKPIASNYINRLESKLHEIGIRCPAYIMQSNGGTTTFEQAKAFPVNLVESGPVAGVCGSLVMGKLIGEENVIAFDIGGTTAKCSLVCGGEVKVSTEYKIGKSSVTAGHPIKVPVVDIVEIGNGGGSIAWLDDAGALRVGPQSAGSIPGPIAYGLGGTEPTTTDANLLLGRLSAKNFSKPVDMGKIRSAIKEKVADKIGVSVEEGAMGIIRIANSNMLNSLKLISVRKGHDPREFSMIAFGGGGPMHAAFLARELGIKKVIVPLGASVFSAWGMLMSDLRQDDLQTLYVDLDGVDFSTLGGVFDRLETKAYRDYAEKDVAAEEVIFLRHLDMRYKGQEHTVKILQPFSRLTADNKQEMIDLFHQAHEKEFSFNLPDSSVEVINVHLVSLGKTDKTAIRTVNYPVVDLKEARIEVRDVHFEGEGVLRTPIYAREKLFVGCEIPGPAIIEEVSVSTILCSGMQATVDHYGNIIITIGGVANE